MGSFISRTNRMQFARIVLELDTLVGVYVYVYETQTSEHPERDYLQDDMEMAMLFCEEDFGVPRGSWAPLISQAE